MDRPRKLLGQLLAASCLFLVFCSSSNSFAGPFDGGIRNVASSECVSLVNRAVTAINTYWTLPSLDSLQRRDIFTPTLIAQNPFQGLSTGQQSITYDVSSEYISSDSKISFGVSGGAKLSLYLPTVMLNAQIKLLFSSAATTTSCTTGTKLDINVGSTAAYSGPWFILYNPDGSQAEIFTISDLSALCVDTSKTMLQVLSNANPRNSLFFAPGIAAYCSASGDTHCSTIFSAIQAVTSNATLATFCATFKNGN